MAVVFSYRSDDSSFNARYSSGGKSGQVVATVTNAVDATAIGGRSVVFQTPASFQLLHWNAASNTPNSRSISVVMRYSPNYNGAPAGRRALWAISTGAGTTQPGILQMYHEVTTGALTIHATNEAGASSINFASFGNWTTGVSGDWYDFVFTWDGTTTANAVKFYIDAASFGTVTAGSALTSSWNNKYRRSILIGGGPTATASSGKLNELWIDDSILDPTSNVSLESGAGLLNGASRTSFMSDVAGSTLTSFDALNSTDPTEAKVESGTTYYINGVLKTGSLSASGGGGHCASQYSWSN